MYTFFSLRQIKCNQHSKIHSQKDLSFTLPLVLQLPDDTGNFLTFPGRELSDSNS